MDVYKRILKEMVKENVTKALNKLGLEGTLEAIEHISNPYVRAKLRIEYLSRFVRGEE